MGQQYNILVLDDNIDVAQSLADLLELEGHNVTLVHNGESAIQVFLSNDFDVGIFDIRMPGINGVEAFLTIKSRRPDCLIAMMSGYADEQLIRQALDAGASGMLSKPFHPEQLLETLHHIVTNRKAQLASTMDPAALLQ